MSLIHSQEELEKFMKLLPPLMRDEVWFVSLSARNKYLEYYERPQFSLTNSEMFCREIIYETHIDNFKRILTALDASLSYRKTKSGVPYPKKAMVVYFNLNPSSMVKAYLKFKHVMDTNMVEMYNSLLDKGNALESKFKQFKCALSVLRTEVQSATSRRVFVDIDFDTKDISYVDELSAFCDSTGIQYAVVSTRSGYHVILKKDTVKCNIKLEIDRLHNHLIAKGLPGEIVINKNHMVPLPGTLQGGHLVEIIKSTIA